VEFVRFNVYDFQAVPAQGERPWQASRYLAFVLPAGEPDQVQMLDLGETVFIDRRIAQFRAAITGDYTRLLQGQPRAEALRAAQLAMKARHPEPYY
jgi:hypothetical protein